MDVLKINDDDDDDDDDDSNMGWGCLTEGELQKPLKRVPVPSISFLISSRF